MQKNKFVSDEPKKSESLGPTITFWDMEILFLELSEKLWSMRRSEEWSIMEDLELSREEFYEVRFDLHPLSVMFNKHASNKHASNRVQGVLRHHVSDFLADLGINKRTSEIFVGWMEENGEQSITLKQSLQLLQVTRKTILMQHKGNIARLFRKYDKDRSNSLVMSEVTALLGDCNICPRTKEEQAEINILLCSADKDCTGLFSLDEFGLMFVMCLEKMESYKYRASTESYVPHSFHVSLTDADVDRTFIKMSKKRHPAKER